MQINDCLLGNGAEGGVAVESEAVFHGWRNPIDVDFGIFAIFAYNFVIIKMNFRGLLIFSISLFCTSCSGVVKPTQNEEALIESIQEILTVKKQLAETYWSEFDKEEYSAPVIFYADSACYALNPKREFLNKFECTKLDVKDFELYRTELLDSIQFHMETQLELDNDTTFYGRTPYVRCSTLEKVQETDDMYSDNSWWIPMVMHEMAHGCQDSHREYYIARGKVNYCVFELEFAQYPIIPVVDGCPYSGE